MKGNLRWGKSLSRKVIAYVMAVAVVLTTINFVNFASGTDKTNAATTVITSMEYYDAANGATRSDKGVGEEVSYAVVLPKFNGQESSDLNIDQVKGDLDVLVKQEVGTGGQWKDIDSVDSFVWNKTFAWEKQEWAPNVFGWILWMKITETTEIKFHGKTNNVDLTYTFTYEKLPKQKLTSISTTESGITADATGGSATHWNLWTFNGDSNILYKQVQDDIDIFVDNNDGKGFVKFLGNANSGFLWDQNFGYYTEGAGGYWFTNIGWSFTLRFRSKSNKDVFQDVKVTYNEPVRTDYKLSPYDGTTYDANTNAAASVGIPLPKVGGTTAIKKDLDLFRYEVKVGNEWIALTDVAACGWIYEGNGFNKYSLSKQWGYFIDTIYGLWFQPVKKDTYIRIYYPENGKAGGDMTNNYVEYLIKGNTDFVPTIPSGMENIIVEDSSDPFVPSGYKMIWNEEFEGTSLDTKKWNYEEGFLLEEDDIGTAGWGNRELEWYCKDNVSVKDGNLNILMKKESKVFTEKGDPSKKATAKYSSGKINTKDKFSLKYGRVDFRAKMPTGTGVWPAMWMLPNDARYGSWPLSGEIDVFEGRGRIPNIVFGTLHYGSQWPNNINTSDAIDMTEDGLKKTDFSDWHVYSVIWEEDNIKVYCDGKCYFKCTNADWYSGSDRGNGNAPFDQRFYLIMNLAAGGTFDSGHVPDESFTNATMQVDYVRAYQRIVAPNADEKPDTIPNVKTDGAKDGLYGDYKLGSGVVTPPDNPTVAPTGNQKEETTTASNIPNTTTKGQVVTSKKKLGRTKVTKATKKKKSKKLSIKFKRVKGAKKYYVQVAKNKKFKKILVKKTVKKVSVTIKSSKLKNKKTLYVRVKAKGASKWSKVKKVRIKK